MATGMQSFLKMANLFGPAPKQEERFKDMPASLPTRQPMNPMSPPLVNRATNPQTRGTYEDMLEQEAISEEAAAQQQELDMMAAFRENVLNPPQREHMTYPASTLDTLNAALKIAAEPSPLEKNRVYVNGNAYQKQRVMYDPVTGEQKFITNIKDPSFSDQVMRAWAAGGTKGPIDVLNQSHEDAVTDWKLQNEALKAGVTAEANMALAKQREAQAGYTGQRAGLEQQKIDINRMTAGERARVSQLNTLTDADKIKLLQEGRISLAELQAAEAMKRVEVQQAGATQRTGMQQTGATQRTGMQQTGANQRNAATIAGQAERQGVAGEQSLEQIEARGAQSRETKAAPSGTAGATAQLPTQQRVGLQNKVAQLISQNPEWEDWITFDARGFPVVEDPGWTGDQATHDAIYQAIYGVPTAVTPSGQTAPIGTPEMQGPGVTTPKPAPKPPTAPAGGAVEMITPDGKSTRMVPANMVQTATQQGYKPKSKGK